MPESAESVSTETTEPVASTETAESMPATEAAESMTAAKGTMPSANPKSCRRMHSWVSGQPKLSVRAACYWILMPSDVAISVTMTQRGCCVEIRTGRNDSGVNHRPKWLCGRGSAAPTAVRAETFGRSTEFMLVATAADRPKRIAVEPSIPLVQNIFAQRRNALTPIVQAHLRRKILGPGNFGHQTTTAKFPRKEEW